MGIDNSYIKEYIKRHVNFYTTSEVSKRGRQLYENDKVFFNEYIEKTDSWKFMVIGSQKYQILVKGVNSQSIHTSCTCMFEWGSICKHSVAALFFVSDNLGGQFNLQYQKQLTIVLPSSNRTGKNNGFEIVGYQHITLNLSEKTQPLTS
jgi:uncharacterized Zn finger protein